MDRRSFLAGLGTFTAASASGCLETMTGGRLSGGIDSAELTARRGEIVDVYDGAITERNDGTRVRNDAIYAFNDESYDQAIEQFETAIDHFDAARTGFRDAAALALDVGEEEAATICEKAAEDAELQVAATQAALNAAEAADGDGTIAEANEHVEEYRDLLERAEEIPVEETQTLIDVLQSD